MFFKLLSLLDNHYVLTYGKRTTLTIDDKVMRFFSEIGFIHSSQSSLYNSEIASVSYSTNNLDLLPMLVV